MKTTLRCVLGVAAVLAVTVGRASAEPPKTLIFHASQPGMPTLDEGHDGGNPFASALVAILASPTIALSALPKTLHDLTYRKSLGFQTIDGPDDPAPPQWMLKPAAAGERRVALVLAFSDYSRANGIPSLPGVRTDARRIAEALTAAGFETETALDPDRKSIGPLLSHFAAHSSTAAAALIYTTGHGVQAGGSVYLLPGDYPVHRKNRALHKRALPLRRIALAANAGRVNLLFYAGCRDNPFLD